MFTILKAHFKRILQSLEKDPLFQEKMTTPPLNPYCIVYMHTACLINTSQICVLHSHPQHHQYAPGGQKWGQYLFPL